MNIFRRKDKVADGKSTEDAATETSLLKSPTPSGRLLVKRHTPFPKPVNPIARPSIELTPEEEKKYQELLDYFIEYVKVTKLPIGPESDDTHEIIAAERAWLSKECFLRYLRATKWNVADAKQRIKDTLLWRRKFGLVEVPGSKATIITADLVEEENLTGKNLIVGYDNENRPCLYLRNGYQNTSASIKQVQLLVYMLERVTHLMPPGQDTLALLIDFKAAPAELNLSSHFPSLSISKQVLGILQSHYPERLGKGLFTNIPWIGQAFFKVVGPFIDPHTRLKTVYDQPFENFVPKEQLDKEFNGDMDFVYDHGQYWPALSGMGTRRYELYLSNFEKLGGAVGLSEYDLRIEGYGD